MENFSLEKVNEINENTQIKDKEFKGLKTYILKTIYPLKSGQTCIFEKDILRIMEKEEVKDQIINRLPKGIISWYRTSSDIKFYDLVSDSASNKIIDTEKKTINNAKPIKAVYKQYSTFSKKVQKQVDTILNHIKMINCNNKEDQYEYLLKIIKNMCLGKKNNIIVLMAGVSEGTGKSLLIKFLQDHVMGDATVCIGSANMVAKGFNYPMFSKRMIVFEEMERIFKCPDAVPTFKTWSTESTISYEDKGKSQFSASNEHTIWGTANEKKI